MGEGEREEDRSETAESGARGRGGSPAGSTAAAGDPGTPGGAPGAAAGGRKELPALSCLRPPVQPDRPRPLDVPRVAEPPSGVGPDQPPRRGASPDPPRRPACRTLPSPADTGGSSRWCTGGTSAVSTLCP